MNKNITQNLETRQVIINEMIDHERESVIRFDLDLKFAQNLQEKLKSGEVKLSTQDMLPSLIDLNDAHEYHLQRLLFFKGLREANKAKKLMKKVKSTTPEKIEVSRVLKEESSK